jgi:putative spermidine/putrescine transport system permease protein
MAARKGSTFRDSGIRDSRTRGLAALFALPLLLILLLFEIMPLGAVLIDGFIANGNWSLANFGEILGSAFQRHAFLASFELSTASAVLGVVVALPIAVILQRLPRNIRRLVLSYANIGANFTGFPIAFAFIIMFGFSGLFTLLLVHAGLVKGLNVYSMAGLVLVYAYFQIQLGLLLLYPALAAITPDLREAARLMGASTASFWRKVGLPILFPALVGTFVLLFANAMGTYATAYALVGGNATIVTIRIGELIGGDVFSDPHQADALASILVVALALPVLAEQLYLRWRRRHE